MFLIKGTKKVSENLFKCISSGRLDLLQKAVENVGHIDNLRDKDGNTLLMMAAKKGKVPFMRFLIKNGANVDAFNNRGDTALHLTACEAFTIAAAYLLTQGANPNICNHKGQTPAEYGYYLSQFDKFNRYKTYLLLMGQAAKTQAPYKIIQSRKNIFSANIRQIIENEIMYM